MARIAMEMPLLSLYIKQIILFSLHFKPYSCSIKHLISFILMVKKLIQCGKGVTDEKSEITAKEKGTEPAAAC